jgi:hypothetical protein
MRGNFLYWGEAKFPCRTTLSFRRPSEVGLPSSSALWPLQGLGSLVAVLVGVIVGIRIRHGTLVIV